MAIQGLRNLCTPASVYLFISLAAMIILVIQNYGFSDTYCLGSFKCNVTSTTLIFVIKLLYVLFWTWILNLICGAGAPSIAWFLVLFPFILMFILLGVLMLQ